MFKVRLYAMQQEHKSHKLAFIDWKKHAIKGYAELVSPEYKYKHQRNNVNSNALAYNVLADWTTF